MKIGIILSLVLVLILGGFFFIMTYSPADDPTSATKPSALEKVELPTDLPAIVEATEVNRDANAAYAAVFAYYYEHVEDFAKNHRVIEDPDEASATKLTDLLVEASKAGHLTRPFLDGIVPMKPGAEPVNDPLGIIPQVVLTQAERSYKAGNKAYAIESAKAVWALGERAIRNSVRLYNRRGGLAAILRAAPSLGEWAAESDPALVDKLNPWSAPLIKLNDAWGKKLPIVRAVRPQIGDLINVAKNDKDLTFRIEATLQLGAAKFNPRTKGNAKAIQRAIDAAKSDADPLVAAAGAAADAFTVQEMRKM
jgi:hypothetical protein